MLSAGDDLVEAVDSVVDELGGEGGDALAEPARRKSADLADLEPGLLGAEDILPTWDLMYFIEAMDRDGNGRIHPDLNHQTPYIVVSLQR